MLLRQKHKSRRLDFVRISNTSKRTGKEEAELTFCKIPLVAV
jgi:hypothetical protein